MIEVGKQAPDFELASHLGGTKFTLSQLQRLYEIVWYAHIGASLCDPRFTLGYIGRYTKRAVLPSTGSPTTTQRKASCGLPTGITHKAVRPLTRHCRFLPSSAV